MGMSIDDHIEALKSYNHGFTGCAGNLQDSINVAVDIMCKYQKIEQICEDFKNGTLKEQDGVYAFQLVRKVIEDGKID